MAEEPVFNRFITYNLDNTEVLKYMCKHVFPFFVCYKLKKLEQFNDWYNSIEEFSIIFKCYPVILYDKIQLDCIEIQHDFIENDVDCLYDCQFQIDFLQFFIFETIDESLHYLVYGCRSIKEFIKLIFNDLKSKSPDLKMRFLDINKNYALNPAFKKEFKDVYKIFKPDIVNSIKFLDLYLKFKTVYANNILINLEEIIEFRMINLDSETLKKYNVDQLKKQYFNMDKLESELEDKHKDLFDNIETDCYKQILNFVKMHIKNSFALFRESPKPFTHIPFPKIVSTFNPVFLIEFLNLNISIDHDKTELTKILNELKMNQTTFNTIIMTEKNISMLRQKVDFVFHPDPNVIYENVFTFKPPNILFVKSFLVEYLAETINNTN